MNVNCSFQSVGGWSREYRRVLADVFRGKARRKLDENRSETEGLPRADARRSATSAERAIEPLWERRHTTPPNSETNATRSEVTVALEERAARGVLPYGNLHRNAISSERTAMEYSESRSEGQASETENKVISRGYGFITHSLRLVCYVPPAYGPKNVGR